MYSIPMGKSTQSANIEVMEEIVSALVESRETLKLFNYFWPNQTHDEM